MFALKKGRYNTTHNTPQFLPGYCTYLRRPGNVFAGNRLYNGNKGKSNFKLLPVVFAVLFLTCLLYGILLNYSIFIVNSSSMEPEYRVGTLVVAKGSPIDSVHVGEVIIYKSDALGGDLAFHRVTRVTEEGVFTKGDMNDFEDGQLISGETYVAKGVFKNYPLGRFLLTIQNPLGFLAFLVFPLLVLILFCKAFKSAIYK